MRPEDVVVFCGGMEMEKDLGPADVDLDVDLAVEADVDAFSADAP